MLSKHVLLAAFLVAAVFAASTLSAAPKIEFESECIDLGTIVCGNPITATFKFTNTGDAELEVIQVRPGCGCTKAETGKNKLAPGESSTITVVFNSSGYSGEVSKSISVMSNDPARPTMAISFKTEVVPLAKLKPERLNFGSVKVNETRTHLLLVYPGDPKTFAITKAEVQGSRVSVLGFRKITAAAGDFWEVKVQVKAGPSSGRIMEHFSLITGPGPHDRINVMVYGNVVE